MLRFVRKHILKTQRLISVARETKTKGLVKFLKVPMNQSDSTLWILGLASDSVH